MASTSDRVAGSTLDFLHINTAKRFPAWLSQRRIVWVSYSCETKVSLGSVAERIKAANIHRCVVANVAGATSESYTTLRRDVCARYGSSMADSVASTISSQSVADMSCRLCNGNVSSGCVGGEDHSSWTVIESIGSSLGPHTGSSSSSCRPSACSINCVIYC